MRVRFVRGTSLGGIGNDANPGDEREMPDATARALVSQGRAVEITDPPKPEPGAAKPRKPKKDA